MVPLDSYIENRIYRQIFTFTRNTHNFKTDNKTSMGETEKIWSCVSFEKVLQIVVLNNCLISLLPFIYTTFSGSSLDD